MDLSRDKPDRTFHPFMNLPAELRERVYEFYLPCRGICAICTFSGVDVEETYDTHCCNPEPLPGILWLPDIGKSELADRRLSTSTSLPLLPPLALSCKQLWTEIAFLILRKSRIHLIHNDGRKPDVIHCASYFTQFLETVSIPRLSAFDLITHVVLEFCDWTNEKGLPNLDMEFMARCQNLEHVTLAFFNIWQDKYKYFDTVYAEKHCWKAAEPDIQAFAERYGLEALYSFEALKRLTLAQQVSYEEPCQTLKDLGVWFGDGFAKRGKTVFISWEDDIDYPCFHKYVLWPQKEPMKLSL